MLWLFGSIAFLLIYSLLLQSFFWEVDHTKEGTKERKRAELALHIWGGVGLAILCGLILYALGWVWYWFCGGIFVAQEKSWINKILMGGVSVMLLGFLLGYIGIIFGWNPFKN